jgi:hypothetical protein
VGDAVMARTRIKIGAFRNLSLCEGRIRSSTKGDPIPFRHLFTASNVRGGIPNAPEISKSISAEIRFCVTSNFAAFIILHQYGCGCGCGCELMSPHPGH